MSIPNTFRPVCGPADVELPYIQPQYKTDLSGYVVEPSVPTTITRTGWSGDPTTLDTNNPLYAFFGRRTPISFMSGNCWYAIYNNSNKMIIDFASPVRVTEVSLLPVAYFAGRYLTGYDVMADGVEIGAVSGIASENPVTWHTVEIQRPIYAKKLELVFYPNSVFGITQVDIKGYYKP